jgi:NhaP-type Na+/H+ or K+/H+ antiporter
MTNEEIKQRIQYLIEHGGLWDDPLDDLRRQIRGAMVLSAIGLVITWVVLATLH